MENYYPIDKNGLIIRVGDYVELPVKKLIIRSQKRKIKNCWATVVEIISKKTVKVKLDKDNMKYWGEYVTIKAIALSNQTYLSYISSFKGVRKDYEKVLNKVYQNIAYRDKETTQEITKLNNDFDKTIQELQIYFYDKIEEINKLEAKLRKYSNILEAGDIVIWNDSMGGFDEVKLCKIASIKYSDPEYYKFKNDFTLSTSACSRYDVFYNIKFKFKENEFQEIINQQNIKTADEFIKYAQENLNSFKYQPKDEHWNL